MLGSGPTKGSQMFNQAIITHVFGGVSTTTQIEAEDLDLFYAKVVGAIQGITLAGSVVTKVVTLTD
jgi:hypothetical protein